MRCDATLGSQAFVDVFALLYHRDMAERLRERPDRIVTHAQQTHCCGMTGDCEVMLTCDEGKEILKSSLIARLIEIITEESDDGQGLRSLSPFVRLLTPEERLKILK